MIPWYTDSKFKIDFYSIALDSDKHAFIDWKRPMIAADGSDFMDFEPGKSYQVYISYYIGPDLDRSDKLEIKPKEDPESTDKKEKELITSTADFVTGARYRN